MCLKQRILDQITVINMKHQKMLPCRISNPANILQKEIILITCLHVKCCSWDVIATVSSQPHVCLVDWWLEVVFL